MRTFWTWLVPSRSLSISRIENINKWINVDDHRAHRNRNAYRTNSDFGSCKAPSVKNECEIFNENPSSMTNSNGSWSNLPAAHTENNVNWNETTAKMNQKSKWWKIQQTNSEFSRYQSREHMSTERKAKGKTKSGIMSPVCLESPQHE